MEIGLQHKYKKLSPMNLKKLKKLNNHKYFIKIDDNWFNLEDIYEIANTNKINPISKEVLTNDQIKKINDIYFNKSDINDDRLLTDYIELFESQINEIYSNQEELYATIQNQQHMIDKLTSTK